MSQPRAFTLIELLVVVTIIVVLLTLLTPALDKAIYQAELAVCGANLHAIGLGVQAYAYNHKRFYPYRPGTHDTSLNWHPMWIRSAYDTRNDDRPVLRGFLSINKNLVDPLSPGRINFDDTPDSADTHMYASYALWFDWQYFPGVMGLAANGVTAQKRMSKIGDKWTWTDPPSLGGSRRRFGVLAGDLDRIHQGELTLNSHPDHAGVLSGLVYQDRPAFGSGTSGAVKQTLSFWVSNVTPRRAWIDMNTAHDDGSVRRTDRVEWDAWRRNDGIVKVPDTTNADAYGDGRFYVQLPRE